MGVMKTSALRRRPSTVDHWCFLLVVENLSLTWLTSTTELFYWSTSTSRKTQAMVNGRPRTSTADAVNVRLDWCFHHVPKRSQTNYFSKSVFWYFSDGKLQKSNKSFFAIFCIGKKAFKKEKQSILKMLFYTHNKSGSKQALFFMFWPNRAKTEMLWNQWVCKIFFSFFTFSNP